MSFITDRPVIKGSFVGIKDVIVFKFTEDLWESFTNLAVCRVVISVLFFALLPLKLDVKPANPTPQPTR